MHRDLIGHGAGPIRGLCSKQFVADLRGRDVGRDEAIEALCQAFGVPRDAAQLFVLSHPAWAEEEGRRPWPWWRAGRG
jgi:hypothetical protein